MLRRKQRLPDHAQFTRARTQKPQLPLQLHLSAGFAAAGFSFCLLSRQSSLEISLSIIHQRHYSTRLPNLMFPTRERLLQTLFVLNFFLFAGATSAQQAAPVVPTNSLTAGRGTWELGAFLGGGTGAGKSSDTRFRYAGGRAGLVLTPALFTSTPVRGNLEYAIEVMPVYTVFTPNGAVYGASIKPFLVQWNFTKPQRLVPFV